MSRRPRVGKRRGEVFSAPSSSFPPPPPAAALSKIRPGERGREGGLLGMWGLPAARPSSGREEPWALQIHFGEVGGGGGGERESKVLASQLSFFFPLRNQEKNRTAATKFRWKMKLLFGSAEGAKSFFCNANRSIQPSGEEKLDSFRSPKGVSYFVLRESRERGFPKFFNSVVQL